jgi:hypothetical protein
LRIISTDLSDASASPAAQPRKKIVFFIQIRLGEEEDSDWDWVLGQITYIP